jgi:electron transport complex protein RnfC
MNARRNKLWHFNGGLHLPGNKEMSTRSPIAKARLPKRLILPLQQHIGEPAEPIVHPGDKVLKGQLIAQANGYVSVPVHASSSGTVIEISEQPVPHPSGMTAPCIVIETDGLDQWIDLPKPVPDYKQLNPSALRNRIRETGIIGLGGAGFPSFIKLNPGARMSIDTLVLNGAECEPYITCDDMLMREHAEEIIHGLQIMRHALQARQCLVGVEDNKPEAYTALVNALEIVQKHQQDKNDNIHILKIPTVYPAGSEKQIIKVLTGKEVPSNGLPVDIGIVCHNMGTAVAIYRAVMQSQPLVSRMVTVTGQGVANPCNLEVALGTPIKDLIEQCGGYTEKIKRLIIGGPMMGFTLPADELPITKTINCVLCASEQEAPGPKPQMPCIRCGECTKVCPVKLVPQQMFWYAHAKDFDKVQDYHLFDCIECGCCAYVCPSHIPLVHYYRYAKTEIWALERDKQKSDIARNRHEFRLDRLAREKAEREERMRKKKEALEKSKGDNSKLDPQKAVIQAAMERVRKKNEEAGITPKNTDNLTDDQQKKIKEADERRVRLQKESRQNTTKEPLIKS